MMNADSLVEDVICVQINYLEYQIMQVIYVLYNMKYIHQTALISILMYKHLYHSLDMSKYSYSCVTNYKYCHSQSNWIL